MHLLMSYKRYTVTLLDFKTQHLNSSFDSCLKKEGKTLSFGYILKSSFVSDVFYVRIVVGLIKTAQVNAYTMHIFGKIELLPIHAT